MESKLDQLLAQAGLVPKSGTEKTAAATSATSVASVAATRDSKTAAAKTGTHKGRK